MSLKDAYALREKKTNEEKLAIEQLALERGKTPDRPESMGNTEAAIMGALGNTMFGVGKPVMAGVKSLAGDVSYSDALKDINRKESRAMRENPTAYWTAGAPASVLGGGLISKGIKTGLAKAGISPAIEKAVSALGGKAEGLMKFLAPKVENMATATGGAALQTALTGSPTGMSASESSEAAMDAQAIMEGLKLVGGKSAGLVTSVITRLPTGMLKKYKNMVLGANNPQEIKIIKQSLLSDIQNIMQDDVSAGSSAGFKLLEGKKVPAKEIDRFLTGTSPEEEKMLMRAGLGAEDARISPTGELSLGGITPYNSGDVKSMIQTLQGIAYGKSDNFIGNERRKAGEVAAKLNQLLKGNEEYGGKEYAKVMDEVSDIMKNSASFSSVANKAQGSIEQAKALDTLVNAYMRKYNPSKKNNLTDDFDSKAFDLIKRETGTDYPKELENRWLQDIMDRESTAGSRLTLAGSKAGGAIAQKLNVSPAFGEFLGAAVGASADVYTRKAVAPILRYINKAETNPSYKNILDLAYQSKGVTGLIAAHKELMETYPDYMNEINKNQSELEASK